MKQGTGYYHGQCDVAVFRRKLGHCTRCKCHPAQGRTRKDGHIVSLCQTHVRQFERDGWIDTYETDDHGESVLGVLSRKDIKTA